MSNWLDSTTPSFDKLTLERLRLASRYEVPAYIANSMSLEQTQGIFDRMVYKLSAEVLAEKLPPATVTETREVVFFSPASPWQHFKDKHSASWWMRWLVRRRPVKKAQQVSKVTMTASFDRYRTFPECTYQFPEELGGYVNVAIPRPIQWEEL